MPATKICPLLGEGRNCILNKCAWFHKLEGRPEGVGLCAILYIGSNLYVINNTVRTAAQARR